MPSLALDCDLISESTPSENHEIIPPSLGDSKRKQHIIVDKGRTIAYLKWPFKPRQLFELVWNYAEFPQYIPNVAKSIVIRDLGPRLWVYQRLSFNALVKDRHYVIVSERSGTRPQDDVYRVTWVLNNRFLFSNPDNDRRIPARFRGCWDIRPSEQGGLDAVYAIELKAGGLIPDWLEQRAESAYVTRLMNALYDRLDSHKP